MALIVCPECQNEVSDKAESCPKCGYPLHNKNDSTETKSIIIDSDNNLSSKDINTTKPKKRKNKLLIGLLVLICIVAIGVAYLFLVASPKIEQVVFTIEAGDDQKAMKPLTFVKVVDNKGKLGLIKNDLKIYETGEYPIKYVVEYMGIQFPKSITVEVVDTKPPVITYKGDAKVQYMSTDNYIDNIVAEDRVDGFVDIKVIEDNVDLNNLGNYTIKVESTDGSGNIGTEIINIEVTDVLNGYESMAVEIVKFIQSDLKNPQSIKLNSVEAIGSDSSAIFKVDYSAQNGFGGFNREIVYLSGTTLISNTYSFFDLLDDMQLFYIDRWNTELKIANEEMSKPTANQDKDKLLYSLDTEKILRNLD